MLAVILSPLYILVHLYIARWMYRWVKRCLRIDSHQYFKWFWFAAVVVYLLFAAAMGVGFLLPTGPVKRFFVRSGNYWLDGRHHSSDPEEKQADRSGKTGGPQGICGDGDLLCPRCYGTRRMGSGQCQDCPHDKI